MSKGAVEEHYASTGIIARVLTALRNVNGPDVPDTLAPIDHFHGKGVVATEETCRASAAKGQRSPPRYRLRHRRAGPMDRRKIRMLHHRSGFDRGVLRGGTRA